MSRKPNWPATASYLLQVIAEQHPDEETRTKLRAIEATLDFPNYRTYLPASAQNRVWESLAQIVVDDLREGRIDMVSDGVNVLVAFLDLRIDSVACAERARQIDALKDEAGISVGPWIIGAPQSEEPGSGWTIWATGTYPMKRVAWQSAEFPETEANFRAIVKTMNLAYGWKDPL